VQTSIWLWLGFNLFVLTLLALDLGLLHRKQRQIGVAEALWLSLGYFILALIFNAGVFYYRGEQAGYEFLTGYLIEKSLSLDNIFVFVLVFSYFAVPAQYQHRVLFWGIIGALVMRWVLIVAGAQLIQTFHWIVFVFGAFLIFTGLKMLVLADAKPNVANNVVVRLMRRHLRVSDDYDGQRFLTRRNGLLYVTPLFVVLAVIEFTDLVFAVDSIPAIFAITQDSFIVYTSNVFAILGLRALYFALAGIVHRFHYLKYGLSLVLVVIGGKMILNGVYGEKVMPTEIALLITAILIGGSIALSLARAGRRLPSDGPSGWIPGSPAAPVTATAVPSPQSRVSQTNSAAIKEESSC
jgi:tellurite resistance protein TerC